MKKRHQEVVSVTYGISNAQIYLTNGIEMKYLLAKIIKWKKEKSVKYNTHNRNSECSSQLFDAIYDNNFELAKNLIDGGKVDVNIKNDCGDTPLIAVCQQTTLKTEEEDVKCINYLWQSNSEFHSSNKSGKTAMNYAESNGLVTIVQNRHCIQ